MGAYPPAQHPFAAVAGTSIFGLDEQVFNIPLPVGQFCGVSFGLVDACIVSMVLLLVTP